MEQATRRATIADVARAAGVSKAAVSFAFNTPERLSADTVTRIREIATSLEYRPDPVARMLAQRRTWTIGILTPQGLDVIFTNPYFGEFSAGVATAAEAAGMAIQFISPLHGSLARAVDRASVDGIITVGLGADHPEVGQIRRSGIPFVVVDSTALPDEPAIEVDDEGGARLAADHLTGLGHRLFLVIGIEPPSASAGIEPAGVTARRLHGYRAGLAAAGLDLPETDMVVGPASMEGGIDAFRRAWAAGARPTAVLAMSDAMAIGAMRAAGDLGLRVPDDVSIVGYDDVDVAQFTNPPLTTVHQPIRRKGEEAVRLLLAGGRRRDEGALEQQLFETRLVVRGTTARAPRGREGVVDDGR
ncbi:MAG TPA: LacI family DNA-binding transcriptional regulator [Candidatus Limnocylindrales bacterium]|nr:LacI family DNA-binding transcriptional regulator [Candidatus Limnocylindrales bacterium]